MNLVNLTLFVIVCIIFAVIQGNPIASDDDLDIGYYWREYNRDVPSDALPGGLDKRGKTTYIGQTSHGFFGCQNEVSVPGQIREAEQKMMYEWGYKQHFAKNQVQILCTHHPENFEWIETNATEIYNLKDKHFVTGGLEKNYTVLIGKLYVDGEIAIGKVLVSNLNYMDGFYSTMNGTYLHIYSLFEVLAYNPKVRSRAGNIKLRKLNFKTSSPNSANIAVAWGSIFVIGFSACFVSLL